MKAALVTGGTGGIGAAITAALESAGYRVLTLGRHDAARADHLVTDLADRAAPSSITRWAGDRLGGCLDLLVNNAALSRKWPLEQVTEAMFSELVGVNLRAPLFLIQQLLPLLKQGGSVVNVSSIRASRGFADDVVYQMAKGGLEAMTRALAVELVDHGIRVNAVAPGAIVTPMNHGVQNDPAALAAATERIPIGRLGTPAEVAQAVRYLADATFVTGHVLTIDGGQSILGGRPVQSHQS